MSSFTAALVLSIVGGAVGQLLMKAGLGGLAQVPIMHVPRYLISNPPEALQVFAGTMSYFCSMFAWIHALKRYELNFAYPLLSLGYVLVYAGAVLWPALHESISLTKTAGVLLIVVGVTVSAQREFPSRACSSPVREAGRA